MTRTTRTFRIPVQAASTETPGSGQILTIGNNTILSTANTPLFEGASWFGATFGAYSGGAFVPGLGTKGSYVIAGTGGHDTADVFDGVMFDFATKNWTRVINTNGAANRRGTITAIGDTNGPHTILNILTASALKGGEYVYWP